MYQKTVTCYLFKELTFGAQVLVIMEKSHNFPRSHSMIQALYDELRADSETLYDEEGRRVGYVSELKGVG